VKEGCYEMTAKQYLNSLKRLDFIINQKTEELEDLKIKSKSLKSIDYSAERVQKSPSTDAPFTKILDSIVDLSNEIAEDIDKLVTQKHTIINQIQEVEDNMFVEILYKRYVKYEKFEKIAVDMNYDYTYIRQLHGQALDAFQKIANF
jgi:hypothetical protein